MADASPPRLCRIDGCDRPTRKGRRICSACEHAIARYGDPDHRERPRVERTCACGCGGRPTNQAEYIRGHRPLRSLADRLWARVERGPGCWEWQGARNSFGYGAIGAEGGRGQGNIGTHRAAWIVTYGPIPDGLFVCHRCDNPPCCRPDHLFLGTNADNVADMVAKGRHALQRRRA